MNSVDEIKLKIEGFSQLSPNWDSYDADEISVLSIINASRIVDEISTFYSVKEIEVFPMRNGGVQIEVGSFKEIEIVKHEVKEISFNRSGEIIKQLNYSIA